MLLYYLFWMSMGLFIYFYIIFGTNLLTQGPVQIAVFLPISVFRRKGISNGIQTESNLRESYFWNKRDPGDLEWMSSNQWGGHEAGGAPTPLGAPSTLVAPPTYFFLLYIFIYPENIQEHQEILFPPLQRSVPKRSHLGAFFRAPPEGASIMEGFYINTIASPMMCE